MSKIILDDQDQDITDEKPIRKSKKRKALDGRSEGHDKRFMKTEEIRIKGEILNDQYFFEEVEE